MVEGAPGEKVDRCGSGDHDAAGVDCDQAVRELYHYLDGELTEERRNQIEVHLDRCGPCADAAGFEAELRLVIANRCRDHVPEELIARVAGAIEEARRHDAASTGLAQ